MRFFPPQIVDLIQAEVKLNINPNAIAVKINKIHGEKYNYRTISGFITRELNQSWNSGIKKYLFLESSIKVPPSIEENLYIKTHSKDTETPTPSIDNIESFIDEISTKIYEQSPNDNVIINHLNTFTKELRKYHAEIKSVNKKITNFGNRLNELEDSYKLLTLNKLPDFILTNDDYYKEYKRSKITHGFIP